MISHYPTSWCIILSVLYYETMALQDKHYDWPPIQDALKRMLHHVSLMGTHNMKMIYGSSFKSLIRTCMLLLWPENDYCCPCYELCDMLEFGVCRIEESPHWNWRNIKSLKQIVYSVVKMIQSISPRDAFGNNDISNCKGIICPSMCFRLWASLVYKKCEIIYNFTSYIRRIFVIRILLILNINTVFLYTWYNLLYWSCHAVSRLIFL